MVFNYCRRKFFPEDIAQQCKIIYIWLRYVEALMWPQVRITHHTIRVISTAQTNIDPFYQQWYQHLQRPIICIWWQITTGERTDKKPVEFKMRFQIIQHIRVYHVHRCCEAMSDRVVGCEANGRQSSIRLINFDFISGKQCLHASFGS